jgi:hypothetical protein
MTDPFDEIVSHVKAKCDALLASTKYTVDSLPKKIPDTGIYLFSQDGCPLYVGRTNNLRKRLQYHTRNNHNQATFAFLLARHETGNLKASYKPNGSRQHLLTNADFRAAFEAARLRIKAMDVQFIEEIDPVKQAILEVLAALRTNARYNDFDNH